MSKTMCPGQDTMFWKPGDVFDIECGGCGNEIEFFKDDAARRCRKCGARVQNPKLNLGCAQWCEHAKECLGYDPKTEVAAAGGPEGALTDRLVEAMKREFGADQKRISHALAVLERAEEILRREPGDPRVVLAAAVLHDIGIQEAEKKHGSSAGRFQELEGPAIAERIMKELGLDLETIDRVLTIVANHHSGGNKGPEVVTDEFKVLWDADWIVNITDEYPDFDREKLGKLIDKVFKTETGGQIARRHYA